MAELNNRISRVDQMYDENGQAFFPITHVDCIIGGVQDLDVGVTLQLLDLTSCISADLKGTLKIKSFNKIVYTLIIDIQRLNNDAFPIDKAIILARDIPDLVGHVDFKAVGAGNESVKVWLENNYLKAMIIPRTERDYIDYEPQVASIVGSGTIIR